MGVRVVGRAAAVGVIAGALAACGGTPALNSDEVEVAIVAGLLEQSPEGEFGAVCPEGIPAVAGSSVECEVTNAVDGALLTVTATQDDDSGNFTGEVTAVS